MCWLNKKQASDQDIFAKGVLDEVKLHLSNGSAHWKAAPKVTNTDARRTQAEVHTLLQD